MQFGDPQPWLRELFSQLPAAELKRLRKTLDNHFQREQQQQQAALQQPLPQTPQQLTPELIAQHGAFATLMCQASGAPPEQVRCNWAAVHVWGSQGLPFGGL